MSKITPEYHILSLSGGKDSTALALLIKEKYPEIHEQIEYVFFDTECELEETYDYLNKLEVFLEKPIKRIKPEKSFDYLYSMYKFLPSIRFRWCTIYMKTETFKKYMASKIKSGCSKIHLYIGIRADEPERIENYQSKNLESEDGILNTRYLLAEEGFFEKDVYNLLETTGIGYPKYYDWRSRSGCYFCFYQRKIEWVELLERHPDLFEKALQYEKNAGKNFTWCQDMSLEELKKPETVAKIKAKYQEKASKHKEERQTLFDTLAVNDVDKTCLFCHK